MSRGEMSGSRADIGPWVDRRRQRKQV